MASIRFSTITGNIFSLRSPAKKTLHFTYMPVTQTFSPSQGIYDVRLRVKSKLGCVAVLTKKVVVLAQKTVTNTSPYVERFEKLDSGGWQIQPDTLRASWRVGKPGTEKKIIGGDATINGNAFWFTGRNSSYNPREKSYLYSNVYDISQLDRPLITFNTFVQMEQSDGVVLQYSLDDKNVADTTKVWNTLGLLRGRDFFRRSMVQCTGTCFQTGKSVNQRLWLDR